MIKTPLSTVIGGAFWTPGATILGSSSKNLTQLIKSLFGLGEQGFAYDPNDLTTLYQDAARTIPVTSVGQPVGLILDKSKGLTVGAELNATALPKITGNAPVATYNSTTKVGTVNRVDVPNQSFIILSSAVGGKWYYVSVKNTGLSQIALRNSNNFGVDTTIANISPNGTFTGYVYVATNYVLGIASALGEGTFIVNTVKEIAGNHAYQTTSSMRPLLQNSPRKIDYDAVDDKLIVSLPAQLTGCTVVRSVPNVGTQILTNQTIQTPHNDNIDNCGLIVINRALTASETSQITKLFNKAAGV